MAMLDELVSNTRELKTGVNEIRKQQEGRRLSAEAAAILVESLRKVEPKELIVVRLFNGTAESIAFGESIETAFKVAGWRSRISTATAVSNGILNGQEIAVGKPDNQAAVQVQRIFKTLGVELGGKLEKQITDNTIEIYIYPVP